MEQKQEVEVTPGQSLADEEMETFLEEEEEDGRRKVSTTCPKCGHTTAYVNGSRRSGSQILSGGGMNMIQYCCAKCSHAWNLSY